jgi:peroxiredoxin
MKKMILMAIALLPAMAFAQDGTYNIQGTIGTYNAPAKVYLDREVKGKEVMDSVVLKDGKFQFSGTIGSTPAGAYLMFNPKGTNPTFKDYKLIYLEKGTITVTGSDLMKNAKAEGTKANNDNAKYEAMMKPISDGQDVIDAKQKAASDEQKKSDAFANEINTAQKALDKQETELNKKFVQENPDSYISFNALESYAYSADYIDIAPLYNNFSDELKQSDAGKEWAKRLPKLKAVALGAIAPEFAEADTSGKVISLSSFRGKYVLVDFWASWCGPCRRENPNVVKAFNKYKGKNFTIVGVSLDRQNGKAKWLAAIHKDGLTWTQLSDLQFWKSKEADMYGVRAIPMNFLIDPDGKIIAKSLHGDDLEDKLAELFGKI